MEKEIKCQNNELSLATIGAGIVPIGFCFGMGTTLCTMICLIGLVLIFIDLVKKN